MTLFINSDPDIFISKCKSLLNESNETSQIIRSIFLYSTALYITDLIDPAIYKQILSRYKDVLSNDFNIGLQPRFIPHLLKYVNGKYHENSIRSFKSIVIKQYRHLVTKFDYFIDSDSVHNLLIKLIRADYEDYINLLIMAYYEDTVTIGELSLICGNIKTSDSSILDISLILPTFYFSPTNINPLLNNLYRYVKKHILSIESISLNFNKDIDNNNCQSKNYRWVCDIVADFTLETPPYILREMISHHKEGYIFGKAKLLNNNGFAGLYMRCR